MTQSVSCEYDLSLNIYCIPIHRERPEELQRKYARPNHSDHDKRSSKLDGMSL